MTPETIQDLRHARTALLVIGIPLALYLMGCNGSGASLFGAKAIGSARKIAAQGQTQTDLINRAKPHCDEAGQELLDGVLEVNQRQSEEIQALEYDLDEMDTKYSEQKKELEKIKAGWGYWLQCTVEAIWFWIQVWGGITLAAYVLSLLLGGFTGGWLGSIGGLATGALKFLWPWWMLKKVHPTSVRTGIGTVGRTVLGR